MNIGNHSFNTASLTVKSRVPFKGREEAEEIRENPKTDSFKVNEGLEYTRTTIGSITGGTLLGGALGAYAGAAIRVFGKNTAIGKAVVGAAAIGAAIGATVGCLMIPFAKEKTRERIYQKQLEFDVMSGVAQKAKNGELSAHEAAAYLNANAMSKMALAQATAANNNTTNTMGLMAGSYVVGRSSK